MNNVKIVSRYFKPVASCASTAANKKWMRGIPLKPRQGGIRGVEGEGSVNLKQRNIYSPVYPDCPGFTPGYSRHKLQGVTPTAQFPFSLSKPVSKSLKNSPSGNDFK